MGIYGTCYKYKTCLPCFCCVVTFSFELVITVFVSDFEVTESVAVVTVAVLVIVVLLLPQVTVSILILSSVFKSSFCCCFELTAIMLLMASAFWTSISLCGAFNVSVLLSVDLSLVYWSLDFADITVLFKSPWSDEFEPSLLGSDLK